MKELNTFHNLILYKTKKFDYKIPEWIGKSITLSLKKRSKLTKRYYSNPTISNKDSLLKQGRECVLLIPETKSRYIVKMCAN